MPPAFIETFQAHECLKPFKAIKKQKVLGKKGNQFKKLAKQFKVLYLCFKVT